MSLSQVSLRAQYTGDGRNERVSDTTFAEIFSVVDPSGVLINSAYNAWCIDATVRLASARSNVNFKTYSSNELADGLTPDALVSYNGEVWDGSEANLDVINWLFNQLVSQVTPGDATLPETYLANSNLANLVPSLAGVTITMGDVQAAIWTILGQESFITDSDVLLLKTYDQSRVDALTAAAFANGEGFVADATQVQGIVLVDNFTTAANGTPAGAVFQPLLVMTKASQLGDYVWFDKDENTRDNTIGANGIQDEDEVGINGVTVKLLRDIDGNGTIAVNEIVATTVTTNDANGKAGYYDFKGLIGGVQYQVLFDISTAENGSSFQLSAANQGTNDALDSDAIAVFNSSTFATNNLSQIVTLTAGEFNQTIDAGFWIEGVGDAPPTADLGDTVWNDANRNGIQDSGEAGISGATVKVLEGGTVIATTTTNSTGYYEFLGLAAGVEYQVSFDISGLAGSRSFALTAANRGTNDALDSDATIVNGVAITSGITLVGGEFNQTIDAGFYDSSAGLRAPGTGTPGFWHQQGLPFWDGTAGNEAKTGGNFPHGELLTPGATGILVGDFNRNGVTDNGENTLFFNFNDAITLVDSKNHKDTNLLGGEKGALMLGRATVASWLNYLAGNSVDLVSGAKDIANYLDNAVSWLDAYRSGSINSTALGNDPLGLGASGNQLATILDNYNNGSAQFATGNFSRG